MSEEEEKVPDPMSHFVDTRVRYDRDFKTAMADAELLLGPQGVIVLLHRAAPHFPVSDMVGLIFFTREKREGRVLVWQLSSYNSETRRHKAQCVLREGLSYGIPVSLLPEIPFICRPSLEDILTKCGDKAKFPLPNQTLGISVRDVTPTSREFVIGSGSDILTTVAWEPEEAPSAPVREAHQDPFKTAAVRAIPVATANALFTGMSLHPGSFATNRSHSMFYDSLTSGGLALVDDSTQCLVGDHLIRIAPPKQMAIGFLQLQWSSLAYFQDVPSIDAVYWASDQGCKDFTPPMVVESAQDALEC
jgi:hypothetical protein